MFDSELGKQLDDILNGDETDVERTNISPSKEAANNIMAKLEKVSTSMLCVMHSFITEQLYSRGIIIMEDNEDKNDIKD